ncbi:MAG TPA: FAD-binding protein [Candidatus Kapabacteria bacterium]|nr:FAD-binding protein [Candidatus Kapabacteria bacterium]
MARSARIVMTTPQDGWMNRHENVTQKIQRLYEIYNPPAPVSNMLGDLQLTVAELRRIIGEALQGGVSVRAFGGTWSLSRAAVTDGWLIDTRQLNWSFTLAPASIAPAYRGDPASLYFAQCGVGVQELNERLAARGRALATSGASNGQTIAGAVATGTHGSAFGFGAMTEYVVGIQLIVSPERTVWLERASYPVVSDDFLARLGAEPVRDDALFNAALVSFGSFGLVHAMMLETVPLYLLEASRRRMPADSALRNAMNTLDFSGLQLPHPQETPWHFEVVFNPHDVTGGAYVTTMYKRPYREDYPKPSTTSGGLGPGDSLLAVVGQLTNLLPGGVIATIANGLIGSQYPTYGQQWGIPGEIFTSTTTHGKGMSMEFGVAHTDSSRVLDLLLAAKPEIDSFAGVMAFRYVKQSGATLGFTRFPITCTVEFNAAHSDRTVAFYNRIWNDLEKEGIPYTLHWGQMDNFTPARVRAMYGAAADQWCAARKALLSERMCAVFSSTYLESCGLAG